MKDGFTTQAQVAFVILPGLNEQEATVAFAAIQRLHKLLRDTFSKRRAVRITSALHGAVLVVPEEVGSRESYDLRERLPELIRRLKTEGLPYRIGVSHGRVEFLRDADERGNFIGEALNTAARIAYAPKNPGLLFHESFTAARSGAVMGSHGLLIRSKPILIPGKKHDPPFKCYRPVRPIKGGTGFRDFKVRGAASPVREVNGVALAFDLTQFSAGDLVTLGHRFRGFVDQLRRSLSHAREGEFFYSPGGDGGILVITGADHVVRGIEMARKIDAALRNESEQHSAGAALRCRVGLRSGSIPLYRNAEGVLRPTGRVCFIADRLAHDRNAGLIVYSEELESAVSGGSTDVFANDFEWLNPPLVCPPDPDVRRFAIKAPSPKSETERDSPGKPVFDEAAAKTIYADVIERMAALFQANPSLLEYLKGVFKTGSSNERDQVAAWLTIHIASNFEDSLGRLGRCRGAGAPFTGDLEEFVRLMLPLSVPLKRVAETGRKAGTRLLPVTATSLTAQLDRAAIAGKPFEGKLDQFRPGVRGKHELDTNVVAGPGADATLADLKDELRDKLRAELRLQLRHRLGWSEDVDDDVFVGYLAKKWSDAPDPFFVILDESQHRLRAWLEKDAVFRHFLIYQKTSSQKEPVLSIGEGALISMVETFVDTLREAQHRAKPS